MTLQSRCIITSLLLAPALTHATTLTYPVFEVLFNSDKPNFASLGMVNVGVGGNFFSDWGTTCSQTQRVCIPDETKTRRWARSVRDQFVYIDDILTLNGDASHDTEVKNKLITILGWIKSERPDLKIGMYAFLPYRDYWTPVNYLDALNHPESPWHVSNLQRFRQKYEEWQAKNDTLRDFAQHVDVIFPSIYTFYPDDPKWELYARANIEEAKRYGKPVYAFIWPQFHPGGPIQGYPYIPGAFWRRQLEFVKQNADGMVIWGAGSLAHDTWNENADWWVQTKQFLETLHTPLPPPPSPPTPPTPPRNPTPPPPVAVPAPQLPARSESSSLPGRPPKEEPKDIIQLRNDPHDKRRLEILQRKITETENQRFEQAKKRRRTLQELRLKRLQKRQQSR